MPIKDPEKDFGRQTRAITKCWEAEMQPTASAADSREHAVIVTWGSSSHERNPSFAALFVNKRQCP